jgi:hypothetical protein
VSSALVGAARPSDGFHDDFEAGDASRWSPVTGRWAVARPPGATFEYTAGGDGENVTLAGSPSWGDYVVSAYGKRLARAGGIGLLARVQGPDRYYQLGIEEDPASGATRWWLAKRDGAAWSHLASGPSPCPLETHCLLRLEVRGAALVASASADFGATFQALGAARDASYPTGRIGLRSSGVAARFDVAQVVPAGEVVGGAGRWIWQAANGPANGWVAFRKAFDVTSLPDAARARIAVDSKYWLWVNGALVVREGGLKRGPNPRDTYYDEVDLRPHLATGRNVLAVLVWHFGRDGFSHKSSGKGGLWMELDLGDRPMGSDPSWKHAPHPAFGAATADPPNYRLPESAIAFDARADLPGWTAPDFDDSSWAPAVDKGAPPAAPWNELWKRPIPSWRWSALKAYVGTSPAPPEGEGGKVVARLPHAAHVTPYLKIDAPAGLRIDLRTDRFKAGGENALHAEYVTRAGVQAFEAFGWLSGEEVHYTFPPGVKILELRYRESGYDTDLVGGFRCDDPVLNRLWSKSARTLYVNMRDTYMDCPDRERAQWWGDAVIEIGQAFYALDLRSHALSRKAISDLVGWAKPTGVLSSPIPGSWRDELPTQSLAAIGWYGFWTYYLYTGDRATIEAIYPAVRRYLGLWALDADGLVVHRAGGWDWSDWGTQIDARLLDNGWYALALRGAAQMARLVGAPADAAAYEARLAALAQSFDRVLWAGTAYRSPGYEGATDDRGNGLAVVAGLAPRARWPAIATLLGTNRHASPYLEKYVLEALYLMDRPDAAIARMKTRYGALATDGLGTLPELWDRSSPATTQNHAWSGGPLTLLSQYAAGVAPEEPGFARFHVLPRRGPLEEVAAALVTVRGRVEVQIDARGGGFALTASVPEGTTATLGLPVADVGAAPTIYAGSYAGSTAVLSKGTAGAAVPGLSYRGVEGGFHRFAAAPGRWRLATRGAGDAGAP